ncbi:MAG: restriction endonuclease subunit S [Candidatus Paceibacterota bacterium]
MIKQRFKKTEIGLIPEEWEISKLSDHIEIIGGGTPKTTIPEYWNGNIPWISVVDFVGDKRWIYDTEKHITRDGLENSSTKLLRRGQIIISARGTVGELSQVTRDMTFNQSCYGIDGKNDLNNDYLYYLLKVKIKEFQQKGHGAVFNTITKETFDQISIPLLRLSEQKAIAKILSDLDSKIELNQHINKTLESMGQALFNHWFVNFEFPDEKGKPYKSSGGEMIESELGEIPAKWKVGKIGEVMENFDSKRIPLSSREREKKKGIYPYYGASCIFDYIDEYIFDGVYLLLGEDGTVMIDNGTPLLQYVWGKFWVNNHAHVLRGKTPMSTEFLYLFFRNTNIQSIITGAVQPKINQQNLNNLKIIIPEMEILQKFNLLTFNLFEKYKINTDEIAELTTIRDSLLPKLMSGQIRVKI